MNIDAASAPQWVQRTELLLDSETVARFGRAHVLVVVHPEH